ncbi:hypothetical protein AK830_g3750 [Neonectria ditissima]|uniref:S-adenosyl-L-methionine-dependent methyltransferase n=1 Tax=Neonectria ditissima TaxID=78410 RepID=A0A0P7B827_9HYPO|nr:hypothetical protein AK830_g3750 [Neonectria ditissima]
MAESTTPEPVRDPQAPATSSPVQVPEDPLQVDDELDDDDSAFDGSKQPFVLIEIEHTELSNGRRYHAFRQGAYLVPNDEEEQERMDLVHHIYTLVLDGQLHLAPISENPQRVLDIGTGTGIWATTFADDHPSAEVLGTDLSPIQPTWTPPNCSFEVDDYEETWLYRRPFEYIHARELEGCVGDEPKLFQQAFQHLAPGGYIELQGVNAEFMCDDGTITKAKDALLWMDYLRKSAKKFGKPVDCAPQWAEKLREAGFEDVKEEVRKLPIGAWPKNPKLKEIGRYQSVQELQVVDSYTPALFAHTLGWSMDEVQVLMAKVKRDLRDPSIHLYLSIYFVWGRKP